MVMKQKLPDDAALADMAMQISMLLDAGLGYPDVVNSVLGPAGRNISDAAYNMAKSGIPLDEILANTGLFPAYFTDMLGVGIETGKAPGSAAALHLYYARLSALKKKLRDAAAQPAMMLAATICVLAVITVKIFPVFGSAYRSAGMVPGAAMSAMLAIGAFLGAYWPHALAGSALAAAASVFAWRCAGIRGRLMKSAGRTRTGRAVANAKLLQCLAMGLDSGMGSLEAMDMAVCTSGRDGLGACLRAVKSGGWVGGALLDAGIITDAQERILKSGLDAGSLPDAMNYVAGAAMDDAERRISKMSGVIEPAISLLGSGLSVLVVLSAMLPLLESLAGMG